MGRNWPLSSAKSSLFVLGRAKLFNFRPSRKLFLLNMVEVSEDFRSFLWPFSDLGKDGGVSLGDRLGEDSKESLLKDEDASTTSQQGPSPALEFGQPPSCVCFFVYFCVGILRSKREVPLRAFINWFPSVQATNKLGVSFTNGISFGNKDKAGFFLLFHYQFGHISNKCTHQS